MKNSGKIITETIIKTDTLIVTQYDTVIQHVTDTLTLTQFIRDTATTFIVLRHAETTGIGSDPALSADGLLRADELLRALKNVQIGAVYSSNYNRTRQTAQPTATDKGLTVQIYDPANQNPLINTVLASQKAAPCWCLGIRIRRPHYSICSPAPMRTRKCPTVSTTIFTW